MREMARPGWVGIVLLIASLANSATDSPSPLDGSQPVAPDARRVGDEVFSKKHIIELMYRVNRYVVAHPYTPNDRNWIRATYYTGVMGLYRSTNDPRILDQVSGYAKKHQWQEGDHDTPVNKLTVGQTYLELYFMKRDPAMIAKMRAYADMLLADPRDVSEIWDYCDTLYVGPPTLAMLGKATGEPKYYEYMNKAYWDTTKRLFDKRFGWFYRDKRFVDAVTGNGKKVFWTRGNGWVLGGIPRILENLPVDHPRYPDYVRLFRQMSAAIAKVQGEDGLWRTNLADPDQYPGPETSGTAFFCYAMAWGINQGLLEERAFVPVVRKAWKGLVAAVDSAGKLGWVQPVGDKPAPAFADQTHEYAAGLFLLAGSEMIKLERLMMRGDAAASSGHTLPD